MRAFASLVGSFRRQTELAALLLWSALEAHFMDPAKRRLGNVVVGTDFTRHAHDAVARAMWLPLSPGCSVTLVHALAPGLPPAIEARLRAAARVMMKVARATALAESERAGLRGVDVFTTVETSRPVELVSECARDVRAELVVVGRGERRSVSERLLGSSAEHIVRAAPCSVLVVANAPDRPYCRALVGVDLSDGSKRAVEAAARFVEGDEAVSVVHAYSAPFADMTPDRFAPPMTPDEIRAYYADVEQSARSLLSQWIPGLGVEMEPLLRRGDPRRVLLEQAAERKVDLIVIGHQERSVLGRLFLGSVATAVVRAATCDVLVVR